MSYSDDLNQLQNLYDAGLITAEEFEAKKAALAAESVAAGTTEHSEVAEAAEIQPEQPYEAPASQTPATPNPDAVPPQPYHGDGSVPPLPGQTYEQTGWWEQADQGSTPPAQPPLPASEPPLTGQSYEHAQPAYGTNPYGQTQQPYAGPQQAYDPNQFPAAPPYQQIPGQYGYAPTGEKSKVVAGVLAILLGSIGVHKFYLGYHVAGVIMLLATILTLGFGGIVTGPIALIEGIIYLTKTDPEFEQIYVRGNKAWF
ncbi:NINE protein [Arcanobacterium haemolyticum]|nr:NINE protein [Arcanobacterium haemolyticum]